MSNAPAITSAPPPLLSRVRRVTPALAALTDQAVSSATNFATGVIVARNCPDEQFGRYVMAFSLTLLLGEALHALVSTPHGILAPRQSATRLREFNGASLLQCGVLGGLCLVGLTVAAAVAWSIGGEAAELSRVLLALAVSAWAILLRQFGRVFSFNLRRPLAALGLDATVMILQLGSLLVLARLGLLSGWVAIAAIGTANAVAVIAWLVRTRGDFEPRPRRAARDFAQAWPIGRWVFFSGVLWVLGVHAYPWLIGGTLGQDAAGVWGVCFGIAAVANPLLMGLQNVIGPAIAHAYPRLSPAGFRRYVAGASLSFAGLLVPFALLAAVYGEHFVSIYGQQYVSRGLGTTVAILAASCVTQALAFGLSRGLFAAGLARQDTVANGLVIALLAVAGYPLIHGWGVNGAAVCLLGSEAVGSLYRAVAFGLFTPSAAEVAA